MSQCSSKQNNFQYPVIWTLLGVWNMGHLSPLVQSNLNYSNTWTPVLSGLNYMLETQLFGEWVKFGQCSLAPEQRWKSVVYELCKTIIYGYTISVWAKTLTILWCKTLITCPPIEDAHLTALILSFSFLLFHCSTVGKLYPPPLSLILFI